MATETKYSTFITNRDAKPRVPNDLRLSGRRFHRDAVVAITSGVDAGSIYPCFPIPSNAVVTSVKVSSPDIGTTTTADVGLYETTDNGAAVKDADFFTAALSLKDGAITKSEVVNGNIITVANMEKRIWEHLALASDPQKDYDVCLTLAGASDAAGSVYVECEYKMV